MSGDPTPFSALSRVLERDWSSGGHATVLSSFTQSGRIADRLVTL